MKHLILFENFSDNDMKAKVKGIVDELSLKYRKGTAFFDTLDDIIKNDINIILALLSGCQDKWVATSGDFGDILYNLYLEHKFVCKGLIVFNGKMLTNNLGVESWKPNNFDLKDKEFVYIDDSYFSGGTVKKIDDFLHSHNSSIVQVNVVYDGSEEKKENVNSFYRYWDYRDLEDYRRKKMDL